MVPRNSTCQYGLYHCGSVSLIVPVAAIVPVLLAGAWIPALKEGSLLHTTVIRVTDKKRRESVSEIGNRE